MEENWKKYQEGLKKRNKTIVKEGRRNMKEESKEIYLYIYLHKSTILCNIIYYLNYYSCVF